ncbi:Cys-Gln thioester bond-forming surface protein [Streptomyces sp. CC208A]|uniref:Cys-Gln thioester bond-forming surface protein n=1 Tax=Streptomyces sp. CC208A TaxID=3044573 RepID=UPI0024A93749|nr:Cys-Gln thioester bond-forming surface protein [Streptomyces sp. CC208A]
MFSVRGRGAARLTAATLVSALAVSGAIAFAGPATADDGGATATLGGLKESGKIWIGDEKGKPINGGLFDLSVDGGGSLQAYCIDLLTPTDAGTKYRETDWDKSTLHDNPNAGKIRWILQNSYPEVNDLNMLAGKAGVAALTGDEAATATQAAIWKYSDNVKATPVDPEAKALAEYLVAEAAKAPDQEEPKVSLAAAPASVAGKAGDRLGPVKVSTTAADGAVKVSLPADAPADVKVVDKDGKAVTSASNDTELFLDVPAGTPDGTTKISLQTETEVAIGRVFGSVEGHEQTLILAGSSKSTVNAEVTAAWAKKGAIPAVTVTENCAKGGLDITASNEGDEDWTFEVKGVSFTIAAGESKTVTVPVPEDTAYDFTITGPNGFSKTFEGVLDCKTAPSPEPSTATPSETPATSATPSETPSTGTPSETPSASPSTPAPSTTTEAGTTGTTGGGLAETGSSNATPMIAGIAVALVLAGGGAVFFLRKKKAAGQ